MRKKESGILTVEASMILSVFVLFVLFLFNFARVYRAQNMVSHAVLQASDAVAMESYLRETAFGGDEADIVQLANRLTGSTTISEESFTSLRSANLPKIAKEKFSTAIANSETNADKVLKNLGVKDGLTGVDFSASQMDLDNNDVILYANYTIELQFPILGMKELSVSKAAKSKTFGEILFALNVIPNNAHYGSVSGGGNYKHGTQVEISASPYYGYTFTGWDTNGDGTPDTGNAPKQTITVTGAQTYTAIFKTDKIPVKLSVKSGKGTVQSFATDGVSSPSGAYDYLSSVTVTATPDTGYKFVGWSGFWYKDENGNGRYDSGEHKESVSWQGESEASHSIGRLEGTYELKAEFELNVCQLTVKVEGVSEKRAGDLKIIVLKNEKGKKQIAKTVTGQYGTNMSVYMPYISGYECKGLKIENADSYIHSGYGSYFTTVPARESITYVAVYEYKPSIYIDGGATNVNGTQFNTKGQIPSGVTVKWKSSDDSVASVSNNGYVTAKKKGTATITASFQYNGKIYDDTVKLTIAESTYEMVYCMHMKNKIRYYNKNHVPNNSTNHHCHSTNCCGGHAKKEKTQSELDGVKKVSPGAYYSGIKYSGYNKSGEVGYAFDNGTGNAIYFKNRQISGPNTGGYYISNIK